MKNIDKFNYSVACTVCAMHFIFGEYPLWLKIWLSIWWIVVAVNTIINGRATL